MQDLACNALKLCSHSKCLLSGQIVRVEYVYAMKPIAVVSHNW